MAVVGGLLAIRGVLGRGRESVARCRGCGQQVTAAQAAGRVEPGDRCPECGRGLGGDGITSRRVDRRRLVAGGLLVAMGLGGAAAWPDAATRIARGPTWWLLAVERTSGGPEAEAAILTELADRRDRGRLSDELTGRIAAEFVARLRAGGRPASLAAAGIDGAEADAWLRLSAAAFAAGTMAQADLEPVVDAAIDLSLRVEPMAPGGMEISWRVRPAFASLVAAGARGPGPGTVTPVALPRLSIQPMALRHAGRPLDADVASWAGARGVVVPATGSKGYSTRFSDLTPAIAAGTGTVELDLELQSGGMSWTRTLSATLVMPGWPPASFDAADADLHRRLLAEPPVLLVGLPEQLRAAGVDAEAASGGARSVDPGRMVGVVELRYDPSVVSFENTLLVPQRRIFHQDRIIPFRAPRLSLSSPPVTASWTILFPEDAAASLPPDGSVVDMELPFIASLVIEVPADWCDPPPAPGQTTVRGVIDPPAGVDEPVRLSGVVLRWAAAPDAASGEGGPG